MQRELKFMSEAINLSKKGLTGDDGGPFGCVIVKDEQIIGAGWNKVVSDKDPTAHAEVVAIRDACSYLGSFQLENCEIFTSCEPCPMCMGAIYWARPKKVYYSNSREDAALIGFDDSFIYDELNCAVPLRKIKMINLVSNEALKVFSDWKKRSDKNRY